jgi:hypothetical protein
MKACTLLISSLLVLISGCVMTQDVVQPNQVSLEGFSEFLPAPLDGNWLRTAAFNGPADIAQFGGGISTWADYTHLEAGCVLRITITGNAPMMQSFSMNFSNPAAAGLTGSEVAYVGEEPITITASGEVQTLTKNYLTQYSGDCGHQAKLAYVRIMELDELRSFQLPSAGRDGEKARASTVGLQWDVAYGGASKDWAYAMTGTYDGGLCTAGRTASKGAGLEDLWLVKVDGEGRLMWEKSFGGPAIDRGRAIVETPEHDLIVAGATESNGAGEFDVWAMKFDAEGNLLWERYFGGTATDWASGAVVTSDGGVALAAYTQDESGGPYDFWVIKLNSDGELLWQRRYGGAATDWSNAIAETADNGLVVVGHTESKGAGGADFWVLKLDADGEPLWDRTFGGTTLDYASAVTTTGEGDIVVAGMTQQADGGGFDIKVLKLTDSGETVWEQGFGGLKNDWVRAVIPTRDGNYALAGYTDSQGAGLYDVWLLKLSADGQIMSERTYGYAGNEWARALVELPDGGLALAGDTYSLGAGAADVLILKILDDN